jgi:hypothetical protein
MRRNCFFLLFMVFAPSWLLANTLYFPQVPYGGGYSTTFIIMNTGTTNVTSTINFYAQSGSLAFSTPINLPVGGSTRFTLSNPGPVTGIIWGVLVAGTATVRGVATFDLRAENGPLITTAGVLGLEAGNSFLLPVDVTNIASTGLAIANVNANSTVNVRLRLLGEDGSQVATANDARLNPLGSRRQVADFVTSMFPQLTGTTFKGTLIVEAASGAPANSLAATALTVKEGLLSALPVVPFTSSSGDPGGPSGSTADVVFSLSLFGGASLQFLGQTFITRPTGGIVYVRNLAAGTYEMSGTLPLGGSVLVGFANGAGSLGVGGVIPGSLQSLAGPSGVGTIVSACNVQYINGVSSSQTFRLQFQLTTSTSAACQTGQ